MKPLTTTILAQCVPVFLALLGDARALAQPAGNTAATDAEPAVDAEPDDESKQKWTVHARPVGDYRPSFAIGWPTRNDGLPRHLVMRLIGKALWIAAPCYERALDEAPADARPALVGVVHARFVVTTQGHTGNALVIGDLPADLRACLSATFRRLRFPKPRACGVAMVEVPIELQLTGRRSRPASAVRRRGVTRAGQIAPELSSGRHHQN